MIEYYNGYKSIGIVWRDDSCIGAGSSGSYCHMNGNSVISAPTCPFICNGTPWKATDVVRSHSPCVSTLKAAQNSTLCSWYDYDIQDTLQAIDQSLIQAYEADGVCLYYCPEATALGKVMTAYANNNTYYLFLWVSYLCFLGLNQLGWISATPFLCCCKGLTEPTTTKFFFNNFLLFPIYLLCGAKRRVFIEELFLAPATPWFAFHLIFENFALLSLPAWLLYFNGSLELWGSLCFGFRMVLILSGIIRLILPSVYEE